MAIKRLNSEFSAHPLKSEFPADHLPLLRWLIFTGVTVFAFVLAWHFGLVSMMIRGDKTYISMVIAVLYVLSFDPLLFADEHDLARDRQCPSGARPGEQGRRPAA